MIRVFFPDETIRDYQLPPADGQLFIIGGAEGNNIQINNPFISSYHAVIFQQAGSYFISDGDPRGKPSEHGTFVNNMRIGHVPYMLNIGDEVILGNRSLRFKFIGKAADIIINGIEYEFAKPENRFVAFMIDLVILIVLNSIITTAFFAFFRDNIVGNGDVHYVVIVFIISAIYFFQYLPSSGQTPGKSIMGIQVIKTNGEIPTVTDTFFRNLVGYFIGTLFVMIGFIWVLFDPRKQAWHDKLANTYVVNMPEKEEPKSWLLPN